MKFISPREVPAMTKVNSCPLAIGASAELEQ